MREYLHFCADVAACAATLAASRISAKLSFRISRPLACLLRDGRTLALADGRRGPLQEASSYRMSGRSKRNFAGHGAIQRAETDRLVAMKCRTAARNSGLRLAPRAPPCVA